MVFLGAPLDLAFDVEPDAGTTVASSCVQAFVVSGDRKLDASKVRIVAQPEVSGRAPSARVQTAVVIDEPVVTVTLTAGCSKSITRHYTFL
ncbi:MAG: hypothetical protein PHI55_07015, partial [Burkholderiaceae bacterium]|nr:hypothetical protein [Burkholderiaceae bacterium]